MSATSIAIIDYGMGNLHSVASALSHVAPDSHIDITADAELMHRADRIIFPGVGAIGDCLAEIRRLGFDTLVPELIATKKPVLGICVGMQALLSHSEESEGVDGLDVFSGKVRFFGEPLTETLSSGETLTHKVPHMGWNQVQQTLDHPLWQGINDDARFYFVHSYYADPETIVADNIAGACHYGKAIAAALARDNVFATQFHPEKSHTDGLQLLKNFVSWNGNR